jgi:hypothetical protein
MLGGVARCCSRLCRFFWAEFQSVFILHSIVRTAGWARRVSQAELRQKYYRMLVEEAVVRLPEDSAPLAGALSEIIEMEQELAD